MTSTAIVLMSERGRDNDPVHLLETARFCVSYGQTTVVHDLNLRIDAGEIYAIVGSNGAGKSSILNGLLGLVSHRGELSLEMRASTT